LLRHRLQATQAEIQEKAVICYIAGEILTLMMQRGHKYWMWSMMRIGSRKGRPMPAILSAIIIKAFRAMHHAWMKFLRLTMDIIIPLYPETHFYQRLIHSGSPAEVITAIWEILSSFLTGTCCSVLRLPGL